MSTTKPAAKTVTALAAAAAKAFGALRDAHRDEAFYFFALYTTEGGSYAGATAWSEEALLRVIAEYKAGDARRSVASLTRDLRFSAPDSPYHDAGGEAFAAFEAGPSLHEACFLALEKLDREGFFGEGAAREACIVNVVYGDMSHERWLEHAKRLNPSRAVAPALPYLTLHVPSGPVTRFGAGAYQVNALTLSRDRSTLAYSGSGGEVGILRVATREPLYEKRRRGEHWASAIAQDGSELFLGDADSVLRLDARTGKTTVLAKTPKPSKLALSPDGTKLVVSTWERPLVALDTTTGKAAWKVPTVKKAAMAFSPCGRWFAAAATVRDNAKKAWLATLSCLAAESGQVLWTAPLGEGLLVSLAWSPDGETILGAAGDWALSPDGERRGTATLTFFAATDGRACGQVPWSNGVDAIAIAPGGKRLAIASHDQLVVLSLPDGAEIARGTGGQESLIDCAFGDDGTVLAVGRDVNLGPAVLELRAT